jgi:Uma2 family endonuclease
MKDQAYLMVALPQKSTRMTETEYLAFDRNNEIKHEYLNGEVFAMAGASWEHNLICAAIIIALGSQLRGKSSRVTSSNLRLNITATGLYTYPDISVICGEPIFVDGEFDTITNPTVIIEILSPSSEAYDRGKKSQHYREVKTLQDYLLVAQDKAHIERYTRQEDGQWLLKDAKGLEAAIEITSIGCTLQLVEVYEGITFPPDNPSVPETK